MLKWISHYHFKYFILNCKNWSSRPTCLLSYFQHNRPNPKGIVQFQQKILFITFSFIVENWEGQFQKDIYWGLFAAVIGTNIVFLFFRSTNLFDFIPPKAGLLENFSSGILLQFHFAESWWFIVIYSFLYSFNNIYSTNFLTWTQGNNCKRHLNLFLKK